MPGGRNRSFFDTADLPNSDKIGSYIIGADGTVISHTTAGGKEALDVNIAGGSISVDFSYDFAEDSAHASGDTGAFILGVRQDTLANSTSADGDYGALKLNSVGSLYVHDTAVLAALSNLDIRDLVFATDKVDVSGSSVSISGTVGVTQSTSPWVVSASDLDIRDLIHTQDSIKIGDGTDFLAINSDGSINVADNHDDLAISAIENTASSVTTTSATLLASQLANREYLFVQNLGDKNIYVGKSGVTTSNGFQLSQKMWMEFRLGAALAMHAVAQSGTQDVRVMELA